MNILIVSRSFFPTNSPRAHRTTELAKELVRKGHNIKVIFQDTGYNYAGWDKLYPGLQICATNELRWKNIQIKDKGYLSVCRRIERRTLQHFFEYPDIEWYFRIPRILKNEPQYDMLISVAVPHTIHWGIARCYQKGMKVAKKWVADCGDPYMGVATDSMKPVFYFAWFEKLFCKYASVISVPTEKSMEAYYPQFRHKIKVIPQGFNFGEIKLETYKSEAVVRFCYAGGFIKCIRDPRPILDALVKCERDFRFYIFTNDISLLAHYIPLLGSRLVINKYIPRLELITFMSTMDFLLNIENGTDRQTPSKLIDYSLSGRPILSLQSKQINVEKLYMFLQRDYSQQYVVKDIQSYDIKNVADRFVTIAMNSN